MHEDTSYINWPISHCFITFFLFLHFPLLALTRPADELQLRALDPLPSHRCNYPDCPRGARPNTLLLTPDPSFFPSHQSLALEGDRRLVRFYFHIKRPMLFATPSLAIALCKATLRLRVPAARCLQGGAKDARGYPTSLSYPLIDTSETRLFLHLGSNLSQSLTIIVRTRSCGPSDMAVGIQRPKTVYSLRSMNAL